MIASTIVVLLVRGTRESARINNLMVALKLLVILAFIGFGIFHVSTANWQPFVPPNDGTFGVFGWSGVLQAWDDPVALQIVWEIRLPRTVGAWGAGAWAPARGEREPLAACCQYDRPAATAASSP